VPNVTVHLLLAERTLESWALEPDSAPFDLAELRQIQAFQQGALGPDLGYFPGGHAFLSDLSHLVRSGDLTRELLSRDRTPLERAFAWGWLTHVLADTLVHPLVGRGVGELLTGDPSRFLAGEDDLVSHVRIETGLDAWISARFPHLSHTPLVPLFDGGSIRFLADAYASTYALDIDLSLFMSSYLASLRMGKRALKSIAMLGSDRETAAGHRPGLASRTLGALAAWAGRNGTPGALTLGYLSPVPPAAWLQDAVMEVVSRFPEEVARVRESPEHGLPNVNLDTGLPEESRAGHRRRVRTLETIARLGGAGLVPPQPHDAGTGLSRYTGAVAVT